MSLLSNVRILPKILAVILLLAGAAGFGSWYAAHSMSAINEGYSNFISKDAQAWVSAPRMQRYLSDFQMLSYRAIAETDDAEMAKLVPLFDKALRDISQNAETIKQNAPRHAERIVQVEAMIKDLSQAIKPVLELALANKNAEATAMMRTKVNPIVEKLQKEGHTLRVSLDQEGKQSAESLGNDANSAIVLTYEIIGASVLVSLAFGFFIAQIGIAKPIKNIVELLQKLANGDYQVDVTGVDRKDEVGDVAKTAMVFKENGLANLRMVQEQKDAELRNATARKAEMHKLADNFESAVGAIISTVSTSATELEAAAQTLTHTAETTQQLSTTVAAASEQASSNVQSVASASEELASSVNEVGRQVQESSRIALEAVKQAEQTDSRINELSQAASRIGNVVKLITAIAEQTNLLALNATIEAARAGEAGRGFAVVASEVKQLAAQTAKATDEIAGQITQMQIATADSVSSIKEISTTIGRISEISGSIAAAVEEQGAATSEIARNVQSTAQGTTEVAANISNVSKGASETGSASAQVLSSAQSLSSEGNRLKIEVEKFLGTVRAA